MPDLRIGGMLDPATHEKTDADTLISSADLTTHGVIVGMTGSGKTGMGVVVIEECLSAGVPVLAIDPKGDLTNLCLTFPALAPSDFEPWLNPGDVAKAGVPAAEYAAQQATTWREGLAGWGIDQTRLASLRAAVEFEVYTPGSTAGRQLNIVGSLQAPAADADPEDTADEIESYVSSLLGMLGIDADPLASREHVLLSALMADSWNAGRDLDLATLLGQVQQPPLRKLGVLELDQFFPSADRAQFAVRLNGLLASPGFATWLAGDPIDIGAMLRTPDGRPRCAIVTTAHLSDEQRSSVTALVLSKLVTWTRRQGGASDLRALLYMDEVAGYLPPTANPPTKKPIMVMLKQARAFGVGVVLSTQNPVDVDYKALSNAGTWLIGRLQTERDKARLVDGLTSATGDVDVSALGDIISSLGKRQFVLKKAGANAPVLTTSRWAMSYLRGPLIRSEISLLADLGLVATAAPAPAAPAPLEPAPEPAPAPTSTAAPVAGHDETPVPPAVAEGVRVSYLDPAAPWAATIGAAPGSHVRPAVIARVHLRFDDTKVDLVHDEEYEAVLFPIPAMPGGADFATVDYDDRDFTDQAPSSLAYGLASADIAKKAWWTSLQRTLADHLVRTRSVEVLLNRELKQYSRVGETREQFAARCAEAAGDKADAAIAALQSKYDTKLRALHARYDTAASASARAASRHEAEHGTGAQVATLLGGLFGGRRSRGSIVTASRRAATSASRVDAAQEKANTVSRAILDLEDELADEVEAIDTRWKASADGIEIVSVPLERTDVRVSELRLAWIPIG
ncbi:MAG: DUF853 family protein [Actinomycetota bacterium]|nr:DUF853 family protein [Actinomycetota bacterium]